MKAIRMHARFVLGLLAFAGATAASGNDLEAMAEAYGFTVFKLGTGLPDYATTNPFAREPEPYQELWRRIDKAKPGDRFCEVETAYFDENSTKDPLRSNVCEEKQFESVRQALGSLTSAIEEKRLSFWLLDPKAERPEGVLIAALQYEADSQWPYPYLGLWWLDRSDESNQPAFLGWFLTGKVHGIRALGGNDARTVFVHHLSCLECHPWGYLTAFDLAAGAKPNVWGDPDSGWTNRVAERPGEVRVRIGDSAYELQAEEVTDRPERERVARAYSAKYGEDLDAIFERPATADDFELVYRLTPGN